MSGFFSKIWTRDQPNEAVSPSSHPVSDTSNPPPDSAGTVSNMFAGLDIRTRSTPTPAVPHQSSSSSSPIPIEKLKLKELNSPSAFKSIAAQTIEKDEEEQGDDKDKDKNTSAFGFLASNARDSDSNDEDMSDSDDSGSIPEPHNTSAFGFLVSSSDIVPQEPSHSSVLDLSKVSTTPSIASSSPIVSGDSSRQHSSRSSTFQRRVAVTLSDYQQTYIRHWQQINSLHQEQCNLQTHRKQLFLELASYEDRLKETEASQSAAIDNEEFDEAEHLNQEIAVLKKRLALLAANLSGTESDSNEIERSRAEQSSSTISSLHRLLTSLDALYAQQERTTDRAAEQEMRQLRKEQSELDLYIEKFSVTSQHIQENLERVNHEEAEVENDIKKHTKDDEEAIEGLKKHMNGLHGELDELLAALDVKKKEISECQHKMDEHDSSIASARTQYQQELSQVHEKKTEILSEKAEHESELYALEQRRVRLQEQESSLFDQKQQLVKQLESLANTRTESTTLITRLEREEEVRSQWIASIQQSRGEVNFIQDKLNDLNAKIEATNRSILTSEAEISQHRAEITLAKAHIPNLQTEKKLFVQQRKFKEAGRVSREIKEFETTIESNINKIASLTNDVTQGKTTLESFRKQQEKISSDLENLEEEHDRTRCLHIFQLKKELEGIISDVSNSSYSSGTELQFLHTELSNFEEEASAICDKHSWNPSYLEDQDDLVTDKSNEALSMVSPTPLVNRQQLLELLSSLELRLQDAVGAEEYESAASLDEQIQELKKQISLTSPSKEQESNNLTSGEEESFVCSADDVDGNPEINVEFSEASTEDISGNPENRVESFKLEED